MGAEMSIKAMRQALEALETHASIGIKADKAITALQQAISAAEKQELVILAEEQEPVTLKVNGIPPFKNPPNDVIDAAFHVSDWAHRNNWKNWRIGYCCSVDCTTTPHPKPEQESDDLTIAYMSGFHDGKNKWVGLTEEEITEIRLKSFDSIATNRAVYEAIEAKLRKKNT
jgi:hypothetical protein